jgi:hypothetical protein
MNFVDEMLCYLMLLMVIIGVFVALSEYAMSLQSEH